MSEITHFGCDLSAGRARRRRGFIYGALAGGLFLLSGRLEAGLVNVEFRPSTQMVTVGTTFGIDVYAVSADGNNQSIGLVGVVIHWDPTQLSLQGNMDTGPFVWASSNFPSGGGGLNTDLTDGDALYRALVQPGGPYATATPAGLKVTTLRFTALAPAMGITEVVIAGCDGTDCTTVLNRHPFDAGVTVITGAIGPPVDADVRCQSAAHCNDSNLCTDDSCGAGNLCVNTPDNSNNPNDGLYCNGVEVACENGEIIVDGGSIPNCDDGKTCTTDSCNEAGDNCQYLVNSNTCFISSVCYSEGTLNPTNQCQACISASNNTAWSMRPAGSACGNANNNDCNHADTCNGAGTCLPNVEPNGAACGDPLDNICTNPDTCNASGSCVPNNAPDNTTCNDGIWCTLTDRCEAGVCSGVGDPCPGRVCDEFNDLCKAVDLEWRDVLPNPLVKGQTVEIGFYAASDTGVNQSISSVSLIMFWDPAKLRLLGKIDNGPYPWLSSSFPNDSALDGLNNTFMDGNGLYQAYSRLAPNPVAIATPSGLLVTTFRFQALTAGMTQVHMVASYGSSTETQVVDVNPAGLIITGSLGNPASITVLDCTNNSHCNDNEFCTGTETCVSNVCQPGTPPTCGNGVFCDGEEECQVGGGGCGSPGNPCSLPETCDEVNNNCGGCLSPTVVVEGSRYLRITPPPGPNSVAIYLSGPPGNTAASCVGGFLLANGAISPTPQYQTPAQWGTLHVKGCVIIPQTTYRFYTDCSPQLEGLFSAPTSAKTWRWGDVDGSGTVTLNDVSAVIDASNGDYSGGQTLQNVDLVPCVPNGIIDNDDVSYAQDALANGPYPCNDPCSGGFPSSYCSEFIPATSAWTLAILGLLIATVGTLRVRSNWGAC